MPAPDVVDLYRSVITLGAFTLFAIAGWLWQLGRQIEDGCPECAHCLENRRVRRERDAAIQEWYASNLGLRDHPDVQRRWPTTKGRRRIQVRVPPKLRRLPRLPRHTDDEDDPQSKS
jgi:hypothetical protein